MKKKILSLVILSVFALISFAPVRVAKADGQTYLRVIDQETPIYSEKNAENLLFYLPYTYYVKVLEDTSPLCHVECFAQNGTLAIDGYVPKDRLFRDGLEVTSPYLSLTVTTVTSTVLYKDANLTVGIQYLFEDRPLTYYGYLPSADGSRCFFVGYGTKLGYVLESAVSPFSMPTHPNELTFLTPEPEQNETPLEQPPVATQTKELRVIIIACLCLAGIFALVVALKNKPKKATESGYYDENEYE